MEDLSRPMPCYSPLQAYRDRDGKVVVKRRDSGARAAFPFQLACGRCRGCRLRKVQDWAIRAMHEAQLHEQNSFVTLTYDKDNLPEDHSLVVKDWQDFAKRLRKRMGPFRFLHCGEYGDRSLRPHYHACIFGLDFRESRIPLEQTKDGHQLYISSELRETWCAGIHTIGELTFDSAAYVAKYTFKQLTGEAGSVYQRVDPTTGECWEVKPEYATMSLRPGGLGYHWFKKYHRDVYPHDFVIVNGSKYRPPPYYDELLKERDPEMHERVIENRKDYVAANPDEHKPARRQVKEKIAELTHVAKTRDRRI